MENKENIHNSKFLKSVFGNYYWFDLNAFAVVFESWNNSDVFVVRQTFYTVEIEVKVSKSDLMREVQAIRYAMTGERPASKHLYTKWLKHLPYFGNWQKRYHHEQPPFVPNEYYFGVPTDLVADALKAVEGTPFGVIAYGGYKEEMPSWGGASELRDRYGLHVFKQAQKIHKIKLNDKDALRLMRKVCNENFQLRGQLHSLKIEVEKS